ERLEPEGPGDHGVTFDANFVLAAVSLLLFLAFVGFFGFLVFHQQSMEPREPTGAELIEQHYAPGQTVEQPTPYYVAPIPAAPDPREISANLDKKIILGAAMLFGIFALVGGYFFTLMVVRADASSERWRDKLAETHQLDQSIERGRNLYANFCFDCHGKTGLGSTDPNQAGLPGLPLNRPQFKYENIKNDPTTLKSTTDLITLTIERGRAKTPPATSMPAGSTTDGGPLNAENKAKKAAGDADWLLHWIQNAPSIKPGIVMPVIGTAYGGQLNDDQIKAIVEYLNTLK